jgi:DNA-directed RNA polymerase specialized sigma24 family protein
MLALVVDAWNRRFELLAMLHLDAAFSLARRHLFQSELADMDCIDPSLNLEAMLPNRADSEILGALVIQIPVGYCKILILREIENLSCRNNAAVICIPASTRTARLSRVKSALHTAWLSGEKRS